MIRLIFGGLALALICFSFVLLSTDTPPPVEAQRYPSEQGWIKRTYPHFKSDPAAMHQARLSLKSLEEASKGARFGEWEFAGPTNVGGRISDIEFDPLDPTIVYAGAATGGIFKSIDEGRTWEPIFDDQAFLPIGDLAVDPSNSNIIYAGTGESNGGHNNFAGGGLFKSTDAGATWSHSGLESTVSIGRVLVDPKRTNRVFVAAVGSYFGPNPERGLFRSEDAGASWEKVLFINDTTGVIDVVMHPENTDTLYASAWYRIRTERDAQLHGLDSGIFRSYDGGESWERLGGTQGLPDTTNTVFQPGSNTIGRIGLTISRKHPNILYALYNDGANISGLFRTDDGGDNWYRVDEDRELEAGDGSFSWYFGQVRVHPENPDTVFVMDVLMMRSTDAGQNWDLQLGTHVDHHAMAFSPDNPDFIIEGNDGGIALSRNAGGGWNRVPSLPVTQFYEIGINPHDPTHLLGGTQDNGTIRTQTGRLDDWTQLFGADGFYVIVDPVDPNVIFFESQRGNLRKTVDNGVNIISAMEGIAQNEPRNWSTPVVMDPHNNRVLYYGTNRLYRTRNAATNWTPISDDLTKQLGYPLLGTITTVAVAPSDSNVVYAGTDDGNVWVTQDYAANWSLVTDGLPDRWVTRIAVHPTDPTIAYATFSGLRWQSAQAHVFRTEDAGISWQDISSNLPDAPVNALAIDPLKPNTVFIGSDIGAFVTENEGATWDLLGEGLPAVSVYDFKINPDSRQLVAGTHGRSMYTLQLDGLPTQTETGETLPSSLTITNIYPNPSQGAIQFDIELAQSTPGRIEVFNILGQKVALLAARRLPAGQQSLQWDGWTSGGQKAPPATYFIRVQTGDKVISRPFVITN